MGSTRNVVAIMLDCDLEVNEIESQSRYFVHFSTNILWKDMNHLISQQAMG